MLAQYNNNNNNNNNNNPLNNKNHSRHVNDTMNTVFMLGYSTYWRNTDLSIEGFFIEIRLRKKTWFFYSSYNPQKNLIAYHLNCIGKNLDSQLGQYENFILMVDFNLESNYATKKNFCQIYGCKNIVKEKTCFKFPIKPTCIDLIIPNRPKSFQESEVIETGLTDFHKMSLTIMRVFYNKRKPKNI